VQEVNLTLLSGNVSKIDYSKTIKVQDEVASFTLCVDRDGQNTTLVRVNAYGSLVPRLRDFAVQPGDFLIVQGELMNRYLQSKQAKTLELKLLDFKKVPIQKGDRYAESTGS
jgi:single-stranded DNA-binding protein